MTKWQLLSKFRQCLEESSLVGESSRDMVSRRRRWPDLAMEISRDNLITKIRECRRSGRTSDLSITRVVLLLRRTEFTERSSLKRLSLMELCMRENGMTKPQLEMAKAPRSGLTVHSMRDTGRTTKPMEREDSFTQMETSTKASGRMIRLTALVSTCTQMALNTRASGRRISNTVKAKRPGLMVLNMKAIISRERKMETETSNGQMAPPILDSFRITTSTEMAFTSGPTNVSTKVNGRITKCTAKVCFHGLTAVSTKVTITTTRNKAMVCSPGLTVANTMVNGSMVNNMARESISHLRVRPNAVNGKKERELDGFLSE